MAITVVGSYVISTKSSKVGTLLALSLGFDFKPNCLTSPGQEFDGSHARQKHTHNKNARQVTYKV